MKQEMINLITAIMLNTGGPYQGNNIYYYLDHTKVIIAIITLTIPR